MKNETTLIKVKNLSTGIVISTIVPNQEEMSKISLLLTLNGLEKYQILKEKTYLAMKNFLEVKEEFSLFKSELMNKVKPENGMIFNGRK